VCCTLAYVLWREGFLRGRVALALAIIVPLLVGFSRVYLNLHWATDVLAGWCAGLLIALLSAALYDRYWRRRASRTVAFAFVAVAGPWLSVGAQTPEQPSAVLITGRDLGLVAEATVGAALVSRFDVPVARMFADSGFHYRHPGFATAAKRASFVTETVLMLTGGTVYGVARLRHDDATADVALHTTESVLSAALFIQVVRGALGRARPYVIDEVGEKRDADPYDFEPLHGFTSFNYRSFPSMHAMASFAVATALTQEMRVRGTPHRQVVSPLLYAGATMPALARLYLDEHWTSDIVMGVFLGIFAGQKVVLYSHDHPDNRVDRALLRPRMGIGLTHDVRGLSFFAGPL
jgi:membrane-associated phospholipid phosphatase